MTISQTLQTAISPTILISGAGLLLLTFTNRLSRTIDRLRELVDAGEESSPEKKVQIQVQLNILWKRAKLIRNSIILLSSSALCAALLIIILFANQILAISLNGLIVCLFSICLALLLGSLGLFIMEVNESLSALAIELQSFLKKSGL